MTAEKEEIKTQWVNALRRGEYKQGTQYLRKTDPDSHADKFCCLGVLCDLAAKAGVIPSPSAAFSTGNNASPIGVYGSNRTSLPVPVMKWVGVKTDMGQFRDGRSIVSLADLNDSGESFATIADLIESNPEGLFE